MMLGSKESEAQTVLWTNERCFQKGLLMFAPVGIGGECIRLAPPLMIEEQALRGVRASER